MLVRSKKNRALQSKINTNQKQFIKMEQTQQTAQTPQGKGMGVAGFVISLVALALYIFISFAVMAQAVFGGGYGLGIFWLVLSLVGTLLSVMGMMKLGKTGGKKGLAITGMILGIVATLLSAMLVMKIGKVQQEGSKVGDLFKNAMENVSDSLKKNMDAVADSLQKK